MRWRGDRPHGRLRTELRGVRPPAEPAARERARDAVLAAHAAAHASRVPARHPARTLAASLAVALVALAGGLTEPGQAVGGWLRDVVAPAPPAAPPPPTREPPRLPGGGRVLAAGNGIVVVASGEFPRGLGPYRSAVWSPHGRFAAVTTARSLLAVTPSGDVRWHVRPPAPPRRPAWAPDGTRLAYLSGPQLRVVVGDGTDDRLFFGHARDVAPAFRPLAAHTIAWVDAEGRARVADVDRAQLLWRSARPVPAGTRALSWSADGRRLLAAGRRRAVVVSLAGAAATAARARGRIAAAAFPPAGSGPPALLEHEDGRSSLRLLGHAKALIETGGRYDGLTWSPDGRWLLTRWGDRWLAVRRDGRSATTVPAQGRPLAWTR